MRMYALNPLKWFYFKANKRHFCSNVFLGRAYEKSGFNENSERAYKSATQSRPKEALAWQGLISLYEKQASKRLDEYHQAASSLAEIYVQEY